MRTFRRLPVQPSLYLASHGYYVSVALRWDQGAEGVGFASELASLAEVLCQFASGDMEGSSANFALPEDLRDQPYERFLAPSATGPFQTAFPSARVGEVLDSAGL